ncbi:MAG TPA: non-homologous end-joining DNA ligase [Candidatus Binatia bacterium]|nr:non-homologous end-joining DNA ligase [Candidatus Binatia bacterium]
MAGESVKIGGKTLALSNLEKVLFPKTGFTKGQVIDYYAQVSHYLIPHLKDRPITLNRLPNGVTGERFYEKRAPTHTPAWVKTFPVSSEGGAVIDYILINDLPTLIWTANLANLEMHPFLAKAPRLERPTMVIFDLDPGHDADILLACEAAFLVKDLLDRLDLRSFVKVSGSKGIHVHVPLNTKVTYEATRPFARSIALSLATDHPKLIVSEMPKSRRIGKVLIDWSQNSEHKSTVAVYSLRAHIDGPFVAMPIEWQELDKALRSKDRAALFFDPQAALGRVKKSGDPFAPLLRLKQTLPKPFLKMMSADPPSGALESYRRKRDFAKTPEPPPSAPRSRPGDGHLFVVQKHAARRLHYDFRLELGGTLKSWAVPKGPPYELHERRLAVAVEDHPLEYARFEGVIPKGEYGGGTVMVWDIGTYELIEGSYEKGKLHVVLHGKKLRGEWILVKGRDRSGKDNVWFLIKGGRSLPRPSPRQEDSSALSGRSMAEIAQVRDAVWHGGEGGAQAALLLDDPPAPDIESLPRAKVEFIPPMLAASVSQLPQNTSQWTYEMKLDGYRCLAGKDSRGVRLWSRRGHLFNEDFPAIAQACARLPDETLLDGEVVALDAEGRPSFNLLQHQRSRARAIRFYAFDILVYRGRSLLGLALAERRRLLSRALRGASADIQLSASFEAEPADLIRTAKEFGFEGIIAKRQRSLYKPGKRTDDWVKYKINRSQELVVGGYTPGHPFDALLVGYHEGEKLYFAAKVRNGFVQRVRREVFQKLKPLVTDKCPFANLPEKRRTPWALTRAEMKNCVWVEPRLVAQIQFTEWTPDGHLRGPSFAGLREDKDPREVTREPVPLAEA